MRNMAMTVRRLCQHRPLGLTIVAGRDGADRIIEWAHAIELADPTPWLSGGELVMTTGINIGAAPDEQFAYVARLAEAGTAALAVDTGTTFDRVPDGIRSAGDELGFPVLAVPPQTPFVAVTRTVLDELTADQVRSVQQVVDQQDTLARATLRGGVAAVVSALGRALAATVVVIDPDRGVLAEHGPDTRRVAGLARGVAESERTRSTRQTSKVIADEHGTCTVQSVTVTIAQRAWLAVGSAEPLAPPQRLLLAHAVALISIELAKPVRVVDAEQRLRSAATRALLAADGVLDEGVLRYFGFEPDTHVAAVALTDVGPLLVAERHATRFLASAGSPYLMTQRDTALVLILPSDRAADVGRNLHRELSAQLERDVDGGLGLFTDLTDVDGSVKQAVAAARVGGAPAGDLVEFASLGTFALLLGTQTRESLDGIARATLGPLDDYDRTHPAASTLVDTVGAFLEHNGHIETAAAALGVHRHTLRNRLAKVEELTGRPLDSAHVRAELWMAVKARELLATLPQR